MSQTTDKVTVIQKVQQLGHSHCPTEMFLACGIMPFNCPKGQC